MLELVKSLEIKTSMLFILYFANNTILWCFFLFSLIIDLYYVSTSVITQSFNPFVGLVVPTEISTKETKAKMETHPVTVETKMSKCSIWLKTRLNIT